MITHHMGAIALREGELGAKLAARLRASEWFEDFFALRDIDDRPRVPGASVCTIEEAIDFLRDMDSENSQPLW